MRHNSQALLPQTVSARWPLEHHTSFTISQRWDSCEDPLFDRDQTHTIPGLCGLISALVCGMCGREKVEIRPPTIMSRQSQPKSFIRNAAPFYTFCMIPVTSAPVNHTAQQTLLFMNRATWSASHVVLFTDLVETLAPRAPLHAPDCGRLGANEDSLLDVLRAFMRYPLTTR